MPGPQRTPTKILKARGSWLAPLREKSEPRPASSLPPPPDWLTAGERSCYRRVCGLLANMHVGGDPDVEAVARYACLLLRWRRAHKLISTEGETITLTTEKGEYVQQRPEVAIVHKLSAELRAIEDRFGMSPSARARLATGGDKDQGKDDTEVKYFGVTG